MNIKKSIYSQIFGVALAAEDASLSEKMQWESMAKDKIASEEVAKLTFEGSEKQVAWVEKIVKSFFQKALSTDYVTIVDYVKALRSLCEEHKDAQYWISRRDKDLRDLFPKMDEVCEDGYRADDQSKEAVWAWIQSR